MMINHPIKPQLVQIYPHVSFTMHSQSCLYGNESQWKMQKLLISNFLWGDLIELIQLIRRKKYPWTSAHSPGDEFRSNGLSARTGLRVKEITSRNVLKPPTTRKAMAGGTWSLPQWEKDSSKLPAEQVMVSKRTSIFPSGTLHYN